ncbi:MAG: hypothetical protein Q9221_007581 [Calogaya cf. arnoldii]
MREVVTSTNLTAADAPLWNTAERHGSVISVVTWLLIITTVFVVVARVVTRYATMNTLRSDDMLAICAMVTAIRQSVACKLPTPWSITSSGKCINLLAFWTYYGIFNIVTDIALIALPVSIVIKLQMKASQKAVIIACDASRLSAIIAQILQLAYLHASIPQTQTPDPIYDLWIPILLGQTVLFFSVISSCFPFLKYLVDAPETGMIRADGVDITHAQLRLGSGADGYSKEKGSQFQRGPFSLNGSAGKRVASANASSDKKRDTGKRALENIEMDRIERGSHWLPNRHCEITAGKKSVEDSEGSQTHIMRKVEWSVTEEKSGV